MINIRFRDIGDRFTDVMMATVTIHDNFGSIAVNFQGSGVL